HRGPRPQGRHARARPEGHSRVAEGTRARRGHGDHARRRQRLQSRRGIPAPPAGWRLIRGTALASRRAWNEEAEAALAGRPGAGCEGDGPLAPRTYIGMGGNAPVFLAPATVEDLAWAVSRLDAAGVGFDVLGAGSNLIVADEGPSFAVLSTERLTGCTIEG